LSPTGEIVASFDEYVRRGSELARFARQLSLGSMGTSLWAVHHAYNYRLVEWSLDGEKLRTIQPTSPWYVPYTEVSFASPETPPSPYAVGVWQDPADPSVLWVIGEIPDESWWEGLEPMSIGQETGYVLDTYHEVVDGFIEAIDAETGDVLASARLDLPFLDIVEPGLVAVGSEDAAGWSYAHVYRVSLQK
jgi:hypothetical protein